MELLDIFWKYLGKSAQYNLVLFIFSYRAFVINIKKQQIILC